jgi:hypothetical protein
MFIETNHIALILKKNKTCANNLQIALRVQRCALSLVLSWLSCPTGH